MKGFSAKILCRAGVIAALYVALTYAFMPFAYGPLQIRPAEALCILPLFFAEAIPALYVGCMLANILGGYGVADIFIGSAITLVAAVGTRYLGGLLKKGWAKMCVGGIFPVLLNATLLPFIFLFMSTAGEAPSATLYFVYFGELFLTQTVWVYGLGAPMYASLSKLRQKGFTPFL